MPALREVLYSGQISEGPGVKAFEAAFGEFVGVPHVSACSSGTAALHLALLVAGVGAGDVVSTAMTAEPTNMAIRHAGASVRWADVDPANGNVTGASVAAAMTERTKAIMVVHYGGVPVPIDDVLDVARDHGVPVVEDAAHALGARYAGRPIGTHSRFVVFSLQAIKHMTTVDGGVLSCQDPADLRDARLLRWFGIDREVPRTEVDVNRVGFKYHMNDVTATIGSTALGHVRPAIDRHIANGRYFDTALAGVDGIEVCRWPEPAEPSYWFYTALVERREDFVAALGARGIAAGTVHRRNDLHSVFADSAVSLPGLDAFAERYVHLPCGWWVDDAARERIIDAVAAGW
ncbi:MAG: DegT/DnrJ/EryC1/StrS family aminotransferase [Solirubrobacteraceae bacterium]